MGCCMACCQKPAAPGREPNATRASQESASPLWGDDHNEPARARVVAELEPEQIRWFYRKAQPKMHKWRPMNGKDSLILETAYRRHQELLREQQERGESKSGKDKSDWNKSAVALGGLYEMAYEPEKQMKPKAKQETAEEKQTADQESTSKAKESKSKKKDKAHNFPYRLKPIYWQSEDRVQLVRGTWFYLGKGRVWQPLDAKHPELVKKIEEEHMKKFAGEPMPDRSDRSILSFRPALCQVNENADNLEHGAEVRWYGVKDVRLYSHLQRSRIWHYICRKLGRRGTKLMRGYRTLARKDDGPPPFTDLVFVVHGIGQKRAGPGAGIVDLVSGMRDMTEHLLDKHFQDEVHRPIFLPVDWRSELEFEDYIIENLTLDMYNRARSYFNDIMMDAMYYASPVDGLKIMHGVSGILNRMYRTFTTHDPGFEARNGRVSLIGHSLGSVICYDLLSPADDAQPPTPPSADRVQFAPRGDPEKARLEFSVHNLFCIGSPLSIFLASRRITGERILCPPGVPDDFRIHNIFHPADMLAYRMEPLVSEVYSTVCPLRIHRVKAFNPIPYEKMPNRLLYGRQIRKAPNKKKPELKGAQPKDPSSKEGTSKEGTSKEGTPKESTSKEGTSKEASKGASPSKEATSPKGATSKEESPKVIPKPEPKLARVQDEPLSSACAITDVKGVKRLLEIAGAKKKEIIVDVKSPEKLPYRVDYALQPSRTLCEWLRAVTAHMEYWTDHDVLMYVLTALYGIPKSSFGFYRRNRKRQS